MNTRIDTYTATTSASFSDADPFARETILRATRHWLMRAVIGLNLCPFAKSVYVKNQIRYAISPARDLEDALAGLEAELRMLARTNPEQIDTTLLIFPHAFADFADFNDSLHFADLLLARLDLDGTLQIASFHPQYQFDGTQPDDIENYTNRAPYPILHLIREASIEKAAAALADPAEIYERNIRVLREMGLEGWRRWMSEEDEVDAPGENETGNKHAGETGG